MNRKEAYQFVLNDLRQVGMFRGIYDARTERAQHHVQGIGTVMEYISHYADEENYMSEFYKNMIESEKRAGIYDDHDN